MGGDISMRMRLDQIRDNRYKSESLSLLADDYETSCIVVCHNIQISEWTLSRVTVLMTHSAM